MTSMMPYITVENTRSRSAKQTRDLRIPVMRYRSLDGTLDRRYRRPRRSGEAKEPTPRATEAVATSQRRDLSSIPVADLRDAEGARSLFDVDVNPFKAKPANCSSVSIIDHKVGDAVMTSLSDTDLASRHGDNSEGRRPLHSVVGALPAIVPPRRLTSQASFSCSIPAQPAAEAARLRDMHPSGRRRQRRTRLPPPAKQLRGGRRTPRRSTEELLEASQLRITTEGVSTCNACRSADEMEYDDLADLLAETCPVQRTRRRWSRKKPLSSATYCRNEEGTAAGLMILTSSSPAQRRSVAEVAPSDPCDSRLARVPRPPLRCSSPPLYRRQTGTYRAGASSTVAARCRRWNSVSLEMNQLLRRR
jgi:hypothetical protein